MALAIFNFPTRYERGHKKSRPMVLAQFANSAAQARARLTARAYKSWDRSIICDEETKLLVEAFLDAHYDTVTSFLWHDPDERDRAGVTPLTAANGVVTAFVLPAGEYPANDGSAKLFRNGTNVALASVDTDARTLNASAAPAAGTLLADYRILRRVVLVAPLDWRWVEDYWTADFQFAEVVA